MQTILGAFDQIRGKFVLILCLFAASIWQIHAQDKDLDQYKLRTTLSWWYSHPSGYFDGQNHEGEFSLSKDFHFGSYSTFTGTLDWRFKRKHHLLFSTSPVSYSNSATLVRTITFQNETYNVGTRVTSDISSLSFAPGYQWDFIRRDRGYIAFETLLNMLSTKATLTGAAAVNGQSAIRTASGSYFAPLPIIGLHARGYPLHSERLSLDGFFNGMYFFGYGDFYSARGVVGIGLSHHWKAIAGYQMGTRLSIHGGSNNIGIRLTQKGAVVGVEGSF